MFLRNFEKRCSQSCQGQWYGEKKRNVRNCLICFHWSHLGSRPSALRCFCVGRLYWKSPGWWWTRHSPPFQLICSQGLDWQAQLKNDIVHFALFHRIQVSELHCLVTSKNVEVDPWVSGRSNSQASGSFLPGQSGCLLLLLVWLVRRALDCDDPEIRKIEISNFETMVWMKILKWQKIARMLKDTGSETKKMFRYDSM